MKLVYAYTSILMFFDDMYKKYIEWIFDHLTLDEIPGIPTTKPITIIKAVKNDGTNITKQMKLFIELFWDAGIGCRGGVPLDQYYYLLDQDKTKLRIIYTYGDEEEVREYVIEPTQYKHNGRTHKILFEELEL
jgi:hypothetical protein